MSKDKFLAFTSTSCPRCKRFAMIDENKRSQASTALGKKCGILAPTRGQRMHMCFGCGVIYSYGPDGTSRRLNNREHAFMRRPNIAEIIQIVRKHYGFTGAK